MNNTVLTLVIFWGIWIILPVVIDGGLAFLQAVVVYLWGRNGKKIRKKVPYSKLPLVSVIIPTYNEIENIAMCLAHLKAQTYPHEKIEIIVVDNGSQDETGKIVLAHKGTGDEIGKDPEVDGKIRINDLSYDTSGFRGSLHLITRYERGKAKALNAGIRRAKGDIIINIDCRSFLAPNAIEKMVGAFLARPQMAAATGNIEIDWDLVYEVDQNGRPKRDHDGHFRTRELNFKETFLAKCQFLEYLASMRLGRQFQDVTHSMYTLAGAFSAFRREVLVKDKHLYKDITVSEDTLLTFDLSHISRAYIGYVASAKAYLKPVLSWERLYGQRVRWSRGEIEVTGLHLKDFMSSKYGRWRSIFLPFNLIVDHTFSFPRSIWFFILPALILFGYHPYVILIANLLMFGFYIGLDFFIVGCCYPIVDAETRQKIKLSFYWIPILWFYRLMLFFFRMAGFLTVLRDKPEWMITNNLIGHIKRFRDGTRHRLVNGRIGKVWQLGKRIVGTIPEIESKK